jgi:lipopolysaccharide export system protein LptC
MSDQAEQERSTKRVWARPGSTHDRLIKLLKFGLPALVGVVLAFLALVPLENRKEISFLLDKNKVPQAKERLKVDTAQYRGQDEAGRPFVLDARQAIQATSSDPTVDISGMRAELQLNEGPAQLTADRARFNPSQNQVNVVGPIQFQAADGYQLRTSDVTIDLHDRSLQSHAEVQGSMPLGTFRADHLSADLPERRVVLEGGARLHIVQGGLTRRR